MTKTVWGIIQLTWGEFEYSEVQMWIIQMWNMCRHGSKLEARFVSWYAFPISFLGIIWGFFPIALSSHIKVLCDHSVSNCRRIYFLSWVNHAVLLNFSFILKFVCIFTKFSWFCSWFVFCCFFLKPALLNKLQFCTHPSYATNYGSLEIPTQAI